MAGSESRGVRFIQREIVRSETSKPSMRSSPWMRGAPHVGFSTTIRKINSRTSFDVCRLPMGLLTLETSFQYKRNPPLCQRTTVSGVTARRDRCHADQNRRMATQKSLSSRSSLGCGCRRFRTASCLRSARFSSKRLRRARKRRTSVPRHRPVNRNIGRSYNRTMAGGRLCH